MAVTLSRENVEAAKVLLSHPLINEIFNDLENAAIERARQAGPLEHDLRAAFITEANTIRSLRSKLHSLKAREASLDDEGAAN